MASRFTNGIGLRIYASASLLCFQCALTAFAQQPDILVSGSPTANPNPVVAGNSVTVSYRILNQGTANANGSTTLIEVSYLGSVYVSQEFNVGIVTTNRFSNFRDVAHNITIPGNAPSGTYLINIILDRYSVLNQSNENNDFASTTVQVNAQRSDLVVTSVSPTPNPVTAGNALNLNWVIRNQGNASAGSSRARVLINDSRGQALVNETYPVSSLGVGSSVSVNATVGIPSSASAGAATVRVDADYLSAVSETDEGNNSRSVGLTIIVAKPDLIVSALSFTPNPVQAGNSVTINYTIANQGNGNARDTLTRVQILASPGGDVIFDETASTPAIAAGSSVSQNRQFVIPISTASGSYLGCVVADWSSLLDQSNSSNDQRCESLQITPGCIYSLSHSGTNAPSSGGAGSFAVNTSIGCAWSASVVSDTPWLRITSDAGTGAGQVNFLVDASPDCLPRSGTIRAAGLDFVITQETGTASYVLSLLSATHSPQGETATFNVTTGRGCSWTPVVTVGSTWLNVVSGSGPGSGQVRYSVAANPDCRERFGTIAVQDQTFSVRQLASSGTYALFPSEGATHPPGPGGGTVTISAGAECPWTATESETWIELTSNAGGNGPGSVSYSVQANPDCRSRSGIITIANQNFTVTQSAGTGTYVLAPADGRNHPAGADGGVIQIATGVACQWSATKNASWIAFTSATSSDGPGSLSYSVEANPDCRERQGIITINGQNFPVTQAAGSGNYVLTQTSASHSATGSSGSVGISVGVACHWTASTDAEWISFPSSMTGNGNGVVAYIAQPNPNCISRTGHVFISGPAQPLQFTVMQAAGAGTYSLSAASASFTPPGGPSSVNVSATLGCTWNTANPLDWVMVISGTGIENGTVMYTVAPYGNGAPRSGTMQIAGRPHTITQLGNDDFVNRISLGSATSLTVPGSNEGTTIEGGEPAHANAQFGSSVWWTWTAPANGLVTLTTRGSSFDTLLAVYTGNVLSSLTPIASNDDDGDSTSALSFNAVAGVTYQIAVDGYNGDAGTVRLMLTLSDAAAAPVIVSTSPLPDGTTSENYFKLLQASGGGFPYTWAVSSEELPVGLTLSRNGVISGVPARAGVSRFTLRVTAANGRSATGEFTIAVTSPPHPPLNDNFISGIALTGITVDEAGSNTDASKEPNEPNHAGNAGGHSVWWKWRAPVSGQVTISTRGTGFDTLLAVYSGNTINGLREESSNDDEGGGLQTSAVRFQASIGAIYHIAVDGANGAVGDLELHIVLEPGPANDDFANAAILSGATVETTGINRRATTEPGEQHHAGIPGGASVWWKWTAPATGVAVVNTIGSDFDTLLAVYSGTSVSRLTTIGSNDDFGAFGTASRVGFHCVAGQTYHIAVDGYDGDTGTIRLQVEQASLVGACGPTIEIAEDLIMGPTEDLNVIPCKAANFSDIPFIRIGQRFQAGRRLRIQSAADYTPKAGDRFRLIEFKPETDVVEEIYNRYLFKDYDPTIATDPDLFWGLTFREGSFGTKFIELIVLRVPRAWNGMSTSRLAPSAQRGLILLTHGTASKIDTGFDGSFAEMAFTMDTFLKKYRNNDWQVATLDWREYSTKVIGSSDSSDSTFGFNAATSAQFGLGIGESLIHWLNWNNFQYTKMHVLSHSSGSWLVNRMMQLKANTMKVQATFFDAFVNPGMDDCIVYCNRFSSTLGSGAAADYVEQYFDGSLISPAGTHSVLTEAVNFEVTGAQIPSPPRVVSLVNPVAAHAWPYVWYLETVRAATNGLLLYGDPVCSGFALSEEFLETDAVDANVKRSLQLVRQRTANGQHYYINRTQCHPIFPATYVPQPSFFLGMLQGQSGVYELLLNGIGVLMRTVGSSLPAPQATFLASALPSPEASTVVTVQTPYPLRSMRFDLQFSGSTNGVLEIAVGGETLRRLGMADSGPDLYSSGEVMLEPALPPGSHLVTLRLTSGSSDVAEVLVKNVELGFDLHLALGTPTLQAGRTLKIPLAAIPGKTAYSLEASSDFSTWTAVTNVTTTNSLIQFTVPVSTNAAQRFFRAVAP